MSRLSLISFDQQGNINRVREWRNSHRFYTLIWSGLWGQYGEPENPYGYLVNPEKTKKLWRLIDDPRLPYEEKIVLACTFDYAIIRRKEFGKLIQCFKEYSVYHESGHMWAIADELVALQEDESIYGIGFEHSISDQWHEWTRKGVGELNEWDEYDEYMYQWDFADPRTYYPFDEISVSK